MEPPVVYKAKKPSKGSAIAIFLGAIQQGREASAVNAARCYAKAIEQMSGHAIPTIKDIVDSLMSGDDPRTAIEHLQHLQRAVRIITTNLNAAVRNVEKGIRNQFDLYRRTTINDDLDMLR